MKMFPMMALAALVIGCDDDKGAQDVSEVSETTAETTPEAETSPETEVDQETSAEVEQEVEEPDPIELVGTWVSEFGEETISLTNWDGFCIQAIVEVDNDDNVAILETVSGEGCATGFSRVVWNDIADDAFDYCTTTYAAASAEEAATAEVVNFSTDLATGCGGFPWSHLTRK